MAMPNQWRFLKYEQVLECTWRATDWSPAIKLRTILLLKVQVVLFFALVKSWRAKDAASLTTLSKARESFKHSPVTNQKKYNSEVWLHHFHLAHLHLHLGQTIFSDNGLLAWSKTEPDFNFLQLIKPRFIWKTKHLKKRSWTCIYGGFWFCFILVSFSVSAILH